MRNKILFIPAILVFQIAGAQTDGSMTAPAPATPTTPVAAASSTPVTPAVSDTQTLAAPASTPANILDYKSVYETATVEEEVKMAAERFNLTATQQEVWMSAAADRRQTEKQVREKLDSKTDFDRNGVYRGLRSSHNTFYETVSGYLSPAQKQAFETDRVILQEKQKKLAKMPPPPPPAPTVTAAPIDSAAIKDTENEKAPAKKAKKKKKSKK